MDEKIDQNRLQNIVNAGIYIFKREIVDIIQEKSFLSLEKLIKENTETNLIIEKRKV